MKFLINRVFLIVVACAATSGWAAVKTKPNVLFIMVDDLAAVAGCYGGAAKTPNIDRLAGEGTAFLNHYVQWPVCGPSRASMLGGLRPDTSEIYEIGNSWQVSKKPTTAPTMPLHFKRNGYRTASFGKVYHGKGSGPGFGWSESPMHPEGGWTCYVDFEYKAKSKGWRPAFESYDGSEAVHSDYRTATAAIDAMDGSSKDTPFFIAVGFYKPHLPFVAPKSYWDLYDSAEVSLIQPQGFPKNGIDSMYNWSELWSYGRPEVDKWFSKDSPPRSSEVRKLTHGYYAAVSLIDAQVGRLLDALDESGLRDNTIVVLWSDHGFHLGSQNRWGKHTQFENAMRSPFLIQVPGQDGLGLSNSIVESLDIYPTLCDLMGLPIPSSAEGESLAPLLRGEDGQAKNWALSQIRPVDGKDRSPMAYSLRIPGYRYVEWRNGDGETVESELYDLRENQSEEVNVIRKRSYRSVVESARSLLGSISKK